MTVLSGSCCSSRLELLQLGLDGVDLDEQSLEEFIEGALAVEL